MAETPSVTETGGQGDRLKLRAVDHDDLAVLAAFLQDAIAGVSEMAYLPEERRFALAVCRFRWERAVDDAPADAAAAREHFGRVFERVGCAVTVETVSEPKYRGFHLLERDRMMPLLTATYDDGCVMLTFGGDAAVKLKVDRLDLRMEDFGPCWPTTQKPEHEAPSSDGGTP